MIRVRFIRREESGTDSRPEVDKFCREPDLVVVPLHDRGRSRDPFRIPASGVKRRDFLEIPDVILDERHTRFLSDEYSR